MSTSHRTRTVLAALALVAVAAPASALAAKPKPHAAAAAKPKSHAVTAAKPKSPVIARFASTAVAGKSIVVTGRNFAHVERVTVDGMKATFKVDSAKKLTVVVPTKAKSGVIEITTAGGMAKSAHALTIKA